MTLVDDIGKAQKQLDALSSVAKEVGLVKNADKTKVLSKNIEPKLEIKLDETVLEMVDDFQYLGAWVETLWRISNIGMQRNGSHFGSSTVWKILHSNADIKLKVKLFNASVLSVLLYATEAYVINAALQNKINTFQTQCLRIILDISTDDHMRNEYIYKQTNKQTNTKPLMQRATKTQPSFLKHYIRRNKDELIQQYCLYVPGHGRRRRGRQKTVYQQHISKIIYGNALVEEKVMQDVAGDRVVWRKVVKAAYYFFDNGWDGANQETKSDITKDKNGENMPHLEITEAVLIQYITINRNYH